MEEDQGEAQSPLKGVVIISLPPRDDPSMGKTVTFYAFAGDPPNPVYEIPEPQLPIHHPPQNPQNPLRFRARFGGARKRVLLGFLGFALFAFVLLNSFYPDSPFNFRNSDSDDDRDESDTFIFPLFPKLGLPGDNSTGDIELKLGRFVLKESGVRIGPYKVNRLASGSKASEVDSSSMVFPVKGNVYPYGLYFTRVFIGNPPRSYFLDVDTGSDLTWIQCDAPCASCAKGPNSLYKPTRGKIVPPKDSLCLEVQKNLKSPYCGDTCKQCDYEVEYADHSSSMGVLVRDDLSLMSSNGSLTKPNVVFGCAYDQQGSLLKSLAKTDGILGLSRSEVSLPAQLASRGIAKNVFGHCLTPDMAGGGYAFIGDEVVPYWNMAWVPMVNHLSVNFYEAEIARIGYGGKKIRLAQTGDAVGRVIFDSGSSYTYFPKQAYADLVLSVENMLEGELIRDASDDTLPLCWHAESPIRSVDDVKHFFRPLTIHFGSKWFFVSTKFQIPPENYLVTNSKGNVCLGILDGSAVHDGSAVILGDVSLRGKLVVYDNENLKIGWTDSNCKNPRRFKSLPFIAGMDLSI